MISDKIRPHHLERKALLLCPPVVGPSALHNRESSALQYAMQGPDDAWLVRDRSDR